MTLREEWRTEWKEHEQKTTPQKTKKRNRSPRPTLLFKMAARNTQAGTPLSTGCHSLPFFHTRATLPLLLSLASSSSHRKSRNTLSSLVSHALLSLGLRLP